MLQRFFDSLRSASHDSGFEVYFRRLQKQGRPGTPKLEEAQQDYQRFTRAATYWLTIPG